MSDDLQEILTHAVEVVKARCNGKVVLTELAKEIPQFSVKQLKRHRDNGFIIMPNGNLGKRKVETKLSPFQSSINAFLCQGITNSSVIFDSIKKDGYEGGVTILKDYIRSHQDLVPAPRFLAVETSNRGRRYETGPGEMFQMDWGFVKVWDGLGNEWQCACFAMVCHHCGLRYIEFFPSARQENLFIGMIHAFSVMGVPKVVLTDNMRSVVNRPGDSGTRVWNKEYEAFQKLVEFETKLCKVAHPFTKGQVERLVRYVKDNFIQGRSFTNLTDLNMEALEWCHAKNSMMTKGRGLVPMDCHYSSESFAKLPSDAVIFPYWAPLRKISYDGYVNFEGRLYGVPLSYSGKSVRVSRSREKLVVYRPDVMEAIVVHKVDWALKPKTCLGQWEKPMPEEKPTAPVTAVMTFSSKGKSDRFSRFSLNNAKGDA